MSQTLLSAVVFGVFALLQHAEVKLGLIDPTESALLTGFNLSGALAFYLAIRLGWNERIAADPSLTMAQTAFALVSIAGSYAITGPARGAVLAIMVLVLAFGMFALSPGRARLLCGLGLMLVAGVMAIKSHTQPQRYPPAEEIIHFGFAVIVTLAVSALSIRFGRLRHHLSRQRVELQAALERIREMATRDELTGLVNRRAMNDLVAGEMARQQRGAAGPALALLDIDFFKRVNDQFGHAAGDRALQHFARCAVAELRGADVVARWGGEEFLLMLPQSTIDQTRACLERLRTVLQSQPVEGVQPELRLNFSAGVAVCENPADIESAIERADQAMYRAKTLGRGRTEA